MPCPWKVPPAVARSPRGAKLAILKTRLVPLRCEQWTAGRPIALAVGEAKLSGQEPLFDEADQEAEGIVRRVKGEKAAKGKKRKRTAS